MYANGKVYAIICRKTERRYIGSTCEPTVAKRLAQHVKDFKSWKEGKGYLASFDIIKDGDYFIVLLELCPCNSKDELRMCEQKHIDSCECINKIKAFKSEKEKIEHNKQKSMKYYYENHAKVREKLDIYYQKHRDELVEKRRERVYCPNCEKEMSKGSLANHKKRCPQLKKEIVIDVI